MAIMDSLKSNEMSCVTSGCHDTVHNVDSLSKVKFWSPLNDKHRSRTCVYNYWIDRELRIAGILLILGLALTVVTLIWKAALAFLVFAGIAALLTLAGIAVYLSSLVSAGAVPR